MVAIIIVPDLSIDEVSEQLLTDEQLFSTTGKQISGPFEIVPVSAIL
jgi:hypothetical protein